MTSARAALLGRLPTAHADRAKLMNAATPIGLCEGPFSSAIRYYSPGMRLHIGSSTVRLQGFTNVDIRAVPGVDIVGHAADLHRVSDSEVEFLFANAVLEHIFVGQLLRVFAEWRRVLSADGTMLCLGIPDFGAVARLYLEEAPGVIGERFDLFNVYRYTHGDPEHATDPWSWTTWSPAKHPQRAPRGWLPQLHKCLWDETYLRSMLADTGLVYTIFRYAYPGETAKLNLGFVAARTEIPDVDDALSQVPDVERFVDRTTLDRATSTLRHDSARLNMMLDYVKRLSRSRPPSWPRRASRRIRRVLVDVTRR